MTISTTMTHEMLSIEKIQQIQKELIVLCSGKSRNIVLVQLRNFEEEEAQEALKKREEKNGEGTNNSCNQRESVGDDIIVNEEETKEPPALPKICIYQTLAPFCLSKKPQIIVPILPKEKKVEEAPATDEQPDGAEKQPIAVTTDQEGGLEKA